MHPTVTTAFKQLFWRLGFDVRRSHPWSAEPNAWLKEIGAKTVLDIGANKGQSVALYRSLFPDAQIYSFEPLPDVYESLVATYGTSPKFKAFNLALGNETGELVMHKSPFHASSSLLKQTQVHSEAFPFSEGDIPVKVQLRRLDSLVEDGTIQLESPLLIKLDVQGFELEVLRGATQTLTKAKALILEISFVELYEGQPLAAEVVRELDQMGFSLDGILQVNSHPVTNRPFQADAIFFPKKPRA